VCVCVCVCVFVCVWVVGGGWVGVLRVMHTLLWIGTVKLFEWDVAPMTPALCLHKHTLTVWLCC
jgi:hypothetical protein